MTDNKDTQDGIRVDLMRQSTLDGMASTEKVRYIIDRIRSGRIVVLEQGLDPSEQSLLIEDTMARINQEDFTGIEIETYPSTQDQEGSPGFLTRIVQKTRGSNSSKSNMTVIGPADRMETLHKDEDQINTILNP